MNQKVFKRRIYISGLIIFIISVFLVIKLFYLHFSGRIIIPGGKKSDVKRGLIKDRNGDILAMSIELNSIFTNPEEISKPVEVAGVLAPILNIPADDIARRLMKKKKFFWLKRKVDALTVRKIKKLGIRGIYLKKEYKRVYPRNNLASNILGFAGIDNTGLEGIEYRYNTILTKGDNGDPGGEVNRMIFGRNIVLTIDRFIQYVSEEEIRSAVKEYNAKQGAVIVMEVKTGGILAIAKYPNINPNQYWKYSPFKRRNFSVIDFIEPGSTLKVLSIAALLKNNPDAADKWFVCKGKIEIYDTTINCTGIHGRVNLHKSLRYSCNVGIIEAIKSLKKEELFKLLKRFGFGKKVDSGLPGESNGILRNPGKWSGLSKYSISIGHEISVTSLQMAAAFSALGNRGVYMAPHIIDSIENGAGETIKKFIVTDKRRVISRKLAENLMDMMNDVVSMGTGKRAASKNYSLAGKTGTSKKFSKKWRKYSDRVISSFIGLGPYKNPEICIYVIIDDPAGKEYGGRIAAPVFRKIADRILPQMGIGRKELLSPGIRSKRERRIYVKKNIMPDLSGMRITQVIKIVGEMQLKYDISYKFYGTGSVYSQKPKPGSAVKNGSSLILYMRE